MACYRCLVTGHVQGVCFRVCTQREALRLGLTGYAKNLVDGSVEVLMCGDEAMLSLLQQWLLQGPAAAQVTDVACVLVNDSAPVGFQIA